MNSIIWAFTGGAVVLIVWHTVKLIMCNRPRHHQPATEPLHQYVPGDYVVFTRDSVGMIMPNGTLYRCGMVGTVLSATFAFCSVELEDGRIVLAPSYHLRLCH